MGHFPWLCEITRGYMVNYLHAPLKVVCKIFDGHLTAPKTLPGVGKYDVQYATACISDRMYNLPIKHRYPHQSSKNMLVSWLYTLGAVVKPLFILKPPCLAINIPCCRLISHLSWLHFTICIALTCFH